MSASVKKTVKVKKLMSNKPLARFFYQGGHTHPVRRTVVLTSETKDTFTGYELREGGVTRTNKQALGFHKTYQKDEISRWGDCKRIQMSSNGWWRDPRSSTLERSSIISLFRDGV